MSTTTTTGTVNWFEVAGPDVSALVSFYGDLFGWSLADPTGDGYFVLDTQGAEGATPGGIWDGGGTGPFILPYIQVPDVDAAVARAKDLGAEVVLAPQPNGPVRYAHVTDPAGNRVALYQPMG